MINQSKQINFQELLKTFFNEKMKSIYTAIPAHVLSFDSVNQTAQVELGIKRIDRNGEKVTPPPILECPVLFLGDNFCIETQIDVGCEGLALFSQRCIDGWINTGGCADNPLMRFFDMSDCLFIAGFRPYPKKIPSFSNNGIKLRNRSGGQFVWLKNDGSISASNGKGTIIIESGGTIKINGVTFDVSGNVSTSGDVSSGNISLKSHCHSGVQGGNGNTGSPI